MRAATAAERTNRPRRWPSFTPRLRARALRSGRTETRLTFSTCLIVISSRDRMVMRTVCRPAGGLAIARGFLLDFLRRARIRELAVLDQLEELGYEKDREKGGG